MATPLSMNSNTNALRNNSNSSTETPSSFRGRCIEVLSPEKVSSLNLWSDVWSGVAVVSFVAFIALSAVAYIAAQILFPIYAPFVALTAIVLAIPGSSYVKKFNEWSEGYTKEAHRLIGIQHHYRAMAITKPAEFEAMLQQRGIDWRQIPGISSQPNALSELKPLLAHAMYLDDVVKKHFEDKDLHSAEALKLATENFSANRDKISDLRSKALFAEERALEAKIDAAFVNAVLRKGDFNEDIETVAERISIPYFERIRGLALGQPAHPVILFKNNSLRPITHSEVVSSSIADLGQRFAAAMA